MRAPVTGAADFIGGHVAEALARLARGELLGGGDLPRLSTGALAAAPSYRG
jgi:nucleoside-diphosphate-sugar epimerase